MQLQAFLFDSVDQTNWSEMAEKYGFTTTTEQSRTGCKYFHCTRDHKWSKKHYITHGCKHTGKVKYRFCYPWF